MPKRPKFWSTFFRLLSEKFEKKGAHSLVPFRLIACALLGCSFAYFLPSSFFEKKSWDVTIAFFAGLLAFNSLMLALGWSAFSKIYEMMNTGLLKRFLVNQNMLEEHLFFIEFVHRSLVFSTVLSGIGLGTTLLSLPVIGDRLVVVFASTFSLWALFHAHSAVMLVNDLVWDAAHMENKSRPYPHVVQNEEER